VVDNRGARPSATTRIARRGGWFIAEAANLDLVRLLAWLIAWSGLSAAFLLEDGLSPEGALEMIELATAELDS
jgi:streptomycin 6-kinase